MVPIIRRTAEKRHGVITTEQLRRCGISNRQIEHLVRTGDLVRLHRSVFRLAGSPESLEQRALAACLACGTGALASHRTAAGLWRILDDPPTNEVTIPRDRRVCRAGIVVHRPRTLAPADVTHVGPIPITRVKRTLIDLLSVLTDEVVERAFDEAIRRKLVTPDAMLDAPGRLRRLAELRLGGAPEGEIERLAMKAIARHGLPAPVPQFEVRLGPRTARIDLAYPQQRVAIELRGEAPHWGRERWQNDHDRKLALERAGWTVKESRGGT